MGTGPPLGHVQRLDGATEFSPTIGPDRRRSGPWLCFGDPASLVENGPPPIEANDERRRGQYQALGILKQSFPDVLLIRESPAARPPEPDQDCPALGISVSSRSISNLSHCS